MPFIIAKTVTYVSSLSVTYVTTLYIPASRHVAVFERLVEWKNVEKLRVFAGTDPLLRRWYRAGGWYV